MIFHLCVLCRSLDNITQNYCKIVTKMILTNFLRKKFKFYLCYGYCCCLCMLWVRPKLNYNAQTSFLSIHQYHKTLSESFMESFMLKFSLEAKSFELILKVFIWKYFGRQTSKNFTIKIFILNMMNKISTSDFLA